MSNLFEKDNLKFNDYRSKYLLSYMAFTTTFGWILLLFVLVFGLVGTLYPGTTPYSLSGSEWIQANWEQLDSSSSLIDFTNANGWLWVQHGAIFIAIIAFVLWILNIMLTYKNFFRLKKMNAFKKVILKDFFLMHFLFAKWIKLARFHSKQQINYHFLRTIEIESINHQEFWLVFLKQSKINYQWIITLIFYILFTSSIIVFICTFILYAVGFDDFEKNFINNYANENKQQDLDFIKNFIQLGPISTRFTYFTTLTNFVVTFYVLFAFFKPKANFFRNNTLTMQVAVYITIVGLIFWVVSFNLEDFQDPFRFFITIFAHAIVPVMFMIYTLVLIHFNKVQPVAFWKSWDYLLAYPFVYATFIYTTPLFTSVSIYDTWTNVNPLNQIVIDRELKNGERWRSSLYLPAMGVFISFYFLFWIYAVKITKKAIFKKKTK